MTYSVESRGLTEKQEEYCQAYVRNGGNGSKAVVTAGYSQKGAPQTAYGLSKLAHITSRIDEISRDGYAKAVPTVMKELLRLATSAKSEMVRSQACVDWLNRSGHKAPDKVINLTGEGNMSEEELVASTIKALEEMVGGTIHIDVGGSKDQPHDDVGTG